MTTANKDIERFDSLPIPFKDFNLAVSKRTAKLLYISKEEPSGVPSGLGVSIKVNFLNGQVEIENSLSKEPSTIYLMLPIQKPADINVVPRPNYFPNYVQLKPEQRWVYLNWLCNISKPIDIGYVFLYYYGLERHLLIGEFDLAIDEIIYLRKHHSNRSFIYYSSRALLYACIMKKKMDKLNETLKFIEWKNLDNTRLIVAHSSGFDLTAKNLIEFSKYIKAINRRYFNNNPDIFEDILNECLISRYGDKFFPFHVKYKIDEIPKVQEITFANISFPSEIRSPALPNFFHYQPFVEELKTIFEEAHTKTKQFLRNKRRNK